MYSQEHTLYLKKIKKKKIEIKICQFLLLIIFILAWELSSYFGILDPFIFSSPSRVVTTFIQMAKEGDLFFHIFVTMSETIVGFVLGTIIGTLCAIILWWNKTLERILDPYLVVFNSLPKTALAPILIVWMGNNVKSVIVTALLTSVIVTILTVLTGFLSVDKDLIKLIETFNGTKKQILTKVILPSSIPTIVNALKVNVGLSFVGVIVGEFLVANEGLGYLIIYGSQTFKMDNVITSIIILLILAMVLYKSVVLLENKLLKNK